MQPMLMVPCAIASHRRSPVAVGNGMLIVVVLGTDVEDCTITVHIGYGRDAVPIVDETLRRSDPFKDWRWCADRKIAAHKEDPAAAVRITDGQSNKSRVRSGLIADIVHDWRSDGRAVRQTKSYKAPDPVRSAAGHAATRAECRPHSAAGHFFWFPNLERAGTCQRDRRPIVCVRRSKPAFLKRRWSETREMNNVPPDFSFLPIVLRAGGCEQRPRKGRNRDQGARCQKAVSTDSHTPSSFDISGCNWEGGSSVRRIWTGILFWSSETRTVIHPKPSACGQNFGRTFFRLAETNGNPFSPLTDPGRWGHRAAREKDDRD